GSRERTRIQRGLIVAQVAMSFVLVVGAALFVQSFRNLIALDTGFRREGVIFARVGDFSDRPTPERIFAAQSELLDRIRSVPQVVSAAATTKVPLDRSSWTMDFVLPASADLKRHSSKFTFVSPQYFMTVGMRIVTGRDFNSSDTAKSRRVALVNETFVRRYLRSQARDRRAPAEHDLQLYGARNAGPRRAPSRTASRVACWRLRHPRRTACGDGYVRRDCLSCDSASPRDRHQARAGCRAH